MTETLTDLRDGLPRQVADADRARIAADLARREADERAEQALRGQRAAEADVAGKRARDAETRSRQAIMAADTRVREATDRLAAVERERGEGTAARAYADQRAQDATGRAGTAEQDARSGREHATFDRNRPGNLAPICGPCNREKRVEQDAKVGQGSGGPVEPGDDRAVGLAIWLKPPRRVRRAETATGVAS